MRKRVVVVGLLTAAIGSIGLQDSAFATTFKPGPAASVKAYDYNDYRATVRPGGFTIPSGYHRVRAVMTISRNGSVLARSVTSAGVRAGTYSTLNSIFYQANSGGTIRIARIRRTVTVKKVNTSHVTESEVKSIRCGEDQSTVASRLGTNGYYAGDMGAGRIQRRYSVSPSDRAYFVVIFQYGGASEIQSMADTGSSYQKYCG